MDGKAQLPLWQSVSLFYLPKASLTFLICYTILSEKRQILGVKTTERIQKNKEREINSDVSGYTRCSKATGNSCLTRPLGLVTSQRSGSWYICSTTGLHVTSLAKG